MGKASPNTLPQTRFPKHGSICDVGFGLSWMVGATNPVRRRGRDAYGSEVAVSADGLTQVIVWDAASYGEGVTGTELGV